MRTLSAACGLLATLLVPGANAQELVVQVPAVFEERLPAPEDHKKKCDVAARLGKHVLEQVQGWLPAASGHFAPQQSSGRNLRLIILGLDGFGEVTDWTTHRGWSVTVRAELYEGSKAVLAKNWRRRSIAGHPEDCQATHKIARVLGGDVSQWLRATLERQGVAQ